MPDSPLPETLPETLANIPGAPGAMEGETHAVPAASLDLTDRAAGRIRMILAKETGARMLRLAVNGGGCSGFQYEFDFAADAAPDDVVMGEAGAQIVIDPVSLDFLRGSVVDYAEELLGARLIVLNPNAKSSCGCGTSFSV